MSVLALFILLLWAPGAWAHPGRLDKDGCHHVHTRFVYRSGKVAEVGQYHCHRKLGEGFRLDGRETLSDPQDQEQGHERETPPGESR